MFADILYLMKKMHITHNNSHSEEWENVVVPVSQGESQQKREGNLSFQKVTKRHSDGKEE